MSLNDEQWLELYTSSLENRKDIVYIKDTIEHHTDQIENCQKDLKAVEIDQSFKKGKVAFLAVGLTTLCTIIINSLFWTFNLIGGSK